MTYKNIKPQVSNKAFVLDTAVVLGNVKIDQFANVWFNATVRGDMAGISIGEGTNIQDNCVVHTDVNLPTKIGKYVTVGHSAIIHAATIGDYALIGMGSVILNGAVIGEKAMVAAGTIVPPGKVVPPNSLALGNPMRIIRELKPEEIEANINNSKEYIALARECCND